MAIKEKLVNLEDLKAVNDHTEEELGGLRSALSTKAEQDGYYQDMTVGDAEQLVATKYVADSEPYTYRTSGGTADIGNRAYLDKIVGGTVAWNQGISYVQASGTTVYGITRTNVSSGNVMAVQYTGTSENTTNFTASGVIENYNTSHKYYITLGVNNLPSGCRIHVSPVDGRSYYIGGLGPQSSFGVNINKGTTVDFTVYPQAFDLTQMFGSTIADYIYSLETATPGAGVAWFRKLFPLDYYPYNPGELISVAGLQSHDMTGFNQCESSLAFGNIDNSGEDSGSYSAYVRTVDYTRTVPGSTYCFYASTAQQFMQLYCIEYDADKKFIARNPLISGSNLETTRYITFKLSNNTNYVRVFIYKNTAFNSTDGIDICINLSWSGTRNGEYTPYEKHSYPLDSTLTLRGVPKLDAQNNLYYDGDEYLPDGTVNRRYGVVDLGTLNWIMPSTEGRFYARLATNYSIGSHANFVCAKYIFDGEGNSTLGYYGENGTLRYWQRNTDNVGIPSEIYIHDDAYTDAATFKTAMSGVMLVYELATPTTETADPYQPVQIVDDWGTEEFVTTGIVPVGHSTRYPANLRDKLQHLPVLASADGYYMINQVGGEMSLVQFRIPQATGLDNGTYTLKATVSGGTPTYTWEADTNEG